MSSELLDAIKTQHDEMWDKIVESTYQIYFDRNVGTYYIPDAGGSLVQRRRKASSATPKDQA